MGAGGAAAGQGGIPGGGKRGCLPVGRRLFTSWHSWPLIPPDPPLNKPRQALHSETAASAQRLAQLQADLGAKEEECAASGRWLEDLEAQLRLLRRGREEDAEERGRLQEDVSGWV